MPFLNTHRNFTTVFGDTDKFFYMKSDSSCLVLIFFLFISRPFFYEKRGGGEKVIRSHFSFLLDKLRQQGCSWEISDRKNIAVSRLLFLSFFSFPTKGISMFQSSMELCISCLPWKGLEAAEPVRITPVICSGLGLHSVPQQDPAWGAPCPCGGGWGTTKWQLPHPITWSFIPTVSH